MDRERQRDRERDDIKWRCFSNENKWWSYTNSWDPAVPLGWRGKQSY